jgi:hypothetical protein
VLSRFKNSFYCCDNEKNIVCIGREMIGKGPFTVLCSSESVWPDNAVWDTRYLWMRKNQLLLEGVGVTFDLQGASAWKKSLGTMLYSNGHLGKDLQFLVAMAAADAPPESLGYLIPHFFPLEISRTSTELSKLTNSIHKRFLDVIDEVRPQTIFLNTRSVDNLFAGMLEQLIGLGPGLTPSGDDFLAGVIMGLYKTGRMADAQYLANHLYRAASNKTTRVSLAFYRALTEGLVTEPFSKLLEIIGSGETELLAIALKQTARMGATSGWDTLAGILFGICLVFPGSHVVPNYIAEAAC